MQPGAPRRGRPRTVTDRDLIAAYMRVHLESDPARWTLGDVARSAGVVPGTIVQRFGSKRGLMEAALRQGLADLAASVEAARELAASDPEAALAAIVAALVPSELTPVQMANSIAQLHVELSDPLLRPLVEQHMAIAAAAFGAVLAAAIDQGVLCVGEDMAIGEVATTAWSGALVRFAITGAGSTRAWVSRAIADVLAPYRVPRT